MGLAVRLTLMMVMVMMVVCKIMIVFCFKYEELENEEVVGCRLLGVGTWMGMGGVDGIGLEVGLGMILGSLMLVLMLVVVMDWMIVYWKDLMVNDMVPDTSNFVCYLNYYQISMISVSSHYHSYYLLY